MAQTFKINSTTLTYITHAQWDDAPDAGLLNGKTQRRRWRGLTLATEAMTEEEFDTLYALEGTRCNLTIPDYEDRDAGDYVVYFGALFDAIRGNHEGPRVENVAIDFRVRI